MKGILVIVPCGQRKIWDKEPSRGPTPARDAYTGAPFKVNREYAERFAEWWVILSAKYGFISPNFMIPGPYNVTFKKLSTSPVSDTTLQTQVGQQGLDRYQVAIGLGGKEYRTKIESAFHGASVLLRFPFANLPIGKSLGNIKKAIEQDRLVA